MAIALVERRLQAVEVPYPQVPQVADDGLELRRQPPVVNEPEDLLAQDELEAFQVQLPSRVAREVAGLPLSDLLLLAGNTALGTEVVIILMVVRYEVLGPPTLVLFGGDGA